ncbi:MAG: Gfo/Idh/MocA family oxidoreductase [Actinomycetaceae bacterium]|nr:Gfo/Idh/MocA family oxidoreductase [Actinomycetaceae bacterium]
MIENTLRVGVMSFAHVHARSYLSLLSSNPRVDVYCSDPDAREGDNSRGAPFAESIGGTYCSTYEELFDNDLDAVVICSENTKHRELTELAAAKGCHVLCEKPMATTVADARAMIQACEDAGVILMVAYPVRFSPDFLALKQAYEADEIGELLTVSGSNNGRIPVEARAWFCDPELAGGGCIVDHTVHVADLFDALTGATPISVRAVGNRILHRDKPDVLTETGGFVHITYDSGVTLVVDCSWSVPDNYPTWGGVTLDLVTDRNIASIAPFSHAATGFSESSSLFYDFGVNTDEILLNTFLEGIRTGSAPQPDGQSGLRTSAIVEAAISSADRGGEPVSTGLV